MTSRYYGRDLTRTCCGEREDALFRRATGARKISAYTMAQPYGEKGVNLIGSERVSLTYPERCHGPSVCRVQVMHDRRRAGCPLNLVWRDGMNLLPFLSHPGHAASTQSVHPLLDTLHNTLALGT